MFGSQNPAYFFLLLLMIFLTFWHVVRYRYFLALQMPWIQFYKPKKGDFFFPLRFSSGLQQSGRCLLVDSAKVMSSYKWQHHDSSLSSSSQVSEMSLATHNTPTARENHLFLIVFSEQSALKAAMALGERNIVPVSRALLAVQNCYFLCCSKN